MQYALITFLIAIVSRYLYKRVDDLANKKDFDYESANRIKIVLYLINSVTWILTAAIICSVCLNKLVLMRVLPPFQFLTPLSITEGFSAMPFSI